MPLPSDEFAAWQKLFDAKAVTLYPATDPSHDILHIRRVVALALKFAKEEQADEAVVLPAAYFHDFVSLPKDHPDRRDASRLSAEQATAYLISVDYPAEYLDPISHAIVTHSFSAGIACETIEAKVVQDADRLDALGAIGILRCLTTGALLGRPYYHADEIFPEIRMPDDQAYTVDHFFVKLFKLANTLQTPSSKAEGTRRTAFMKEFLAQLRGEVSGTVNQPMDSAAV